MEAIGRTRVTTRQELVMRTPVNMTEFLKAYNVACNAVNPSDMWVTHGDDEVIIYWEEVTQ